MAPSRTRTPARMAWSRGRSVRGEPEAMRCGLCTYGVAAPGASARRGPRSRTRAPLCPQESIDCAGESLEGAPARLGSGDASETAGATGNERSERREVSSGPRGHGHRGASPRDPDGPQRSRAPGRERPRAPRPVPRAPLERLARPRHHLDATRAPRPRGPALVQAAHAVPLGGGAPRRAGDLALRVRPRGTAAGGCRETSALCRGRPSPGAPRERRYAALAREARGRHGPARASARAAAAPGR